MYIDKHKLVFYTVTELVDRIYCLYFLCIQTSGFPLPPSILVLRHKYGGLYRLQLASCPSNQSASVYHYVTVTLSTVL